jgi:hypothetical protein
MRTHTHILTYSWFSKKERKRYKIVKEGNGRDKERREEADTRKKRNSRVVVEFRRVPQGAVAPRGPLYSLLTTNMDETLM